MPNSNQNPISVDELLSAISFYTGKTVSVTGIIIRDGAFRVFVVGEDSPTEVELSYPNLHDVIFDSRVPINVPHGLLHKTRVHGTVQVEGGKISINDITYLAVHGIECINCD